MNSKKKNKKSLFKSCDDWQFNACLNLSPENLYFYIEGYKKAAEILVKNAMKKRGLLDFMIYPICFLYRQYIELRLKEIIKTGRTLIEKGSGFPQHHKLDILWESARDIILEAFSNDCDPVDLSFIEYIVSEFSSIDYDSMAFRYPFDKNGKNLLVGIKHINIRHLSENIDRFAKEINGISEALLVYLDQKRDMAQDFHE